MGCFRRSEVIEEDRQLPEPMSLINERGSFSGFIHVWQKGSGWQHQLGVITSSGILVLYKEARLGRTYKLVEPAALRMKKKNEDKMIVMLTTCADRKVKLKLVGPQMSSWAARLVQPKGDHLGHQSHAPGQLPPASDHVRSVDSYSSFFWRSSRSSSSVVKSSEGNGDDDDERFSYSLPLNSSEESIVRLLQEEPRQAAAAGKVHSILTDTSISLVERKHRLSAVVADSYGEAAGKRRSSMAEEI